MEAGDWAPVVIATDELFTKQIEIPSGDLSLLVDRQALMEEVLEEYPEITREQAMRAVELAAKFVNINF